MVKKLVLTMTGILFVFAPAITFAQEAQPTESETNQDTTSETQDNATGEGEMEVTDEEYVYVIYVDKTCPHCRDAKEFIADNDIEEHVEYVELYQNEENYNQLVALWDENDVPDEQRGWPFMVVNDDPFEYVVGGEPIIDFLAEEFNIDTSDSNSNPDSSSNSALLLVGGVVILGVLGYGIYTILGAKDGKK
jgi:glutaredoxin